MGKYFGTDGFRGEANINLTVEHAYKVGRYIGWYFNQKSSSRAKIVIGKDTRRSSYMFENALVAGLTASGADAYMLYVTTTPSVAYVVRTEQFDCGIMISASHNPYYDNGIKLINAKGHKMEAEVENEIEAYIDGEIHEIPFATKKEIGRAKDYAAGRNHYIGYLISTATRSFKGVKVGLDCSNGSSFAIAENVFKALGAETHVINNEPDGTNINTNCGSTHIEILQGYVKENHLDVGFAYDGDADRCIAVDENGQVVDGDLILYVCGQYLKKHGDLNNKEGIKYEKTAVGDKYVNENMVKNGHALGGEQSGHIIFSKFATTGDGILTSLKIMEAMIEQKQSLAQLAEPVEIFPQILENVRVYDKAVAQADEDVQKAVKEVEAELGDEGRILVRESGTEPLVRVMVEARSHEICREKVDKVVKVLREKGHVIK